MVENVKGKHKNFENQTETSIISVTIQDDCEYLMTHHAAFEIFILSFLQKSY